MNPGWLVSGKFYYESNLTFANYSHCLRKLVSYSNRCGFFSDFASLVYTVSRFLPEDSGILIISLCRPTIDVMY